MATASPGTLVVLDTVYIICVLEQPPGTKVVVVTVIVERGRGRGCTGADANTINLIGEREQYSAVGIERATADHNVSNT